MTEPGTLREEDLHALIDGELPPGEAARVRAALAADPALAEQAAAFTADKAALAAAYRPIAEAPLPAEWIARIRHASAVPPARPATHPVRPVGVHRVGVRPRQARLAAVPRRAMALAACLVLALGGISVFRHSLAPRETILAQAEAARQSRGVVVARLTGAGLADAPARDAMLARATGLQLHTPDLARLGWRLAELDTYAQAAALRYRAADGRALTLYVRRSDGTPRFDLLRNGALRTCIWQDEVVGAVMMGEMTAGQMMRVASAAYVALNL